MPRIHINTPHITTELSMTDEGAHAFSNATITFVEFSGALIINILGEFGQTEDTLRQKIVHAIDPKLEDRIGELITKVIDDYRADLNGRLDPDEHHPADEPLDVVRVDILAALKELFHQEPDLPHEKPDPHTQPAPEPSLSEITAENVPF